MSTLLRLTRFLAVCGMAVPLLWGGRTLAQTEAPPAVQGALARADALFSGHFVYRVESQIGKERTARRFDLLVSGGSWIRRERYLAADVPQTFSESARKAGFGPETVKP